MNSKTQNNTQPKQPAEPQAIVSVIIDDVTWNGERLDFFFRSVDIPAPSVAAAKKLAEKIRVHGLSSRNPDAGIVEQRIPPRSIRKITVLDIAAYQAWQAAQQQVEREAQIRVLTDTRPEEPPTETETAAGNETQTAEPLHELP